jgi:hypothetical protein
VQSPVDVFGERNRFGIAEDLNGFARGVDNDAAVGAAGQMLLQVAAHVGVEDSIEITGEFLNYFLAVH